MRDERFFAFARSAVGGVGLPTDELLVDGDVVHLLQRLDVAGEVSVGEIQQFLQRIEVGCFIHHKHRHDAEPDPALESLVEIYQQLLHFSYLKYIDVP